MKNLTRTALSFLFTMIAVGSVNADLIINPTISASGGGAAQGGSALANVTNSSGLLGSLDDGDQLPAVLPNHEGQGGGAYPAHSVRWFNADVPVLTFDLGGTGHNLTGIILHNYQEEFQGDNLTNRGMASATVEVSPDGVNYSSAGTLNFAQAIINRDGTVAAEFISFAQTNVSHVRFSNIVNHGGALASLVGFGEIRFVEVPAVPEPASASIIGLSLIALFARRRRAA